MKRVKLVDLKDCEEILEQLDKAYQIAFIDKIDLEFVTVIDDSDYPPVNEVDNKE